MVIKKLHVLFLILLISLAGCSQSRDYDAVNEHIDAQGIVLGQDPDTVFTTLGAEPEQEMCVYGYEYYFEDAGLNIGFRLDDDTVRRVTIRNMNDSMFGLHVGQSMDDVMSILSDEGFQPDTATANRYVKDDLYFTAVSKDGSQIDQLILEVIDDGVL